MRHLIFASTLLWAVPIAAQDATPPSGEASPPASEEDWSEGFRMLREGSRRLLERLLDEFGPALEELEGFVDDIDAYEAPVILPNGDILIRRKQDVPPPDGAGPDIDPEEGIEL
ncbi:hypothetical protein [Celeribacter indicus]|uniref:AAA+ family ATPase n=1 Tax=Celeribacter indicus TaxID=1208324 RepID=A0A0B5E6Z1_9RHOB|nr:hypothetical protein [Celeribacter indicus]AJE48077.1 hypothetical protein P73_3362 [Celeribacter indicus]SDW32026.1 hypothetical protein SAMN05443573_102358 [Celeribacter indicus]